MDSARGDSAVLAAVFFRWLPHDALVWFQTVAWTLATVDPGDVLAATKILARMTVKTGVPVGATLHHDDLCSLLRWHRRHRR